MNALIVLKLRMPPESLIILPFGNLENKAFCQFSCVIDVEDVMKVSPINVPRGVILLRRWTSMMLRVWIDFL